MKNLKVMMTLMMCLLIVFITSCSLSEYEKDELKVTNDGITSVENGRGIIDTIPFKCIGCVENLNYDMFNDVIKESSKIAKNNLNNPLSFKPISMDIIIVRGDSLYSYETNKKIDSVLTVITTYEYIGQNAYGTELGGEQLISFTLVDGIIKDISEDIKLEDLKFNDKYINRTLSVYNGSDFIKVTPTNKKSIIVESSLNCVDEGAIFMVTLLNDKEIEIKSWNDFNCDGLSYFDFYNKTKQDMLKGIGIKYLYIYSRGKSVMVKVPKNKSDYFQQLINLY
jgi:hypothetical protein